MTKEESLVGEKVFCGGGVLNINFCRVDSLLLSSRPTSSKESY